MPIPVFFTKKQKAQMRKRRRKRKLETQNDGSSGDGRSNAAADDVAETQHDVNHDDDPITKRQRRPLDQSVDADMDVKQQSRETTTTITIPSHLSGKEARKFRKDERRKFRAGGGDDEVLTFVVEGQEEESKEESPQDTQTARKKKRTFPRINDLLEQQKEQKRLAQEEEQRLAAEARIPEQVKSNYIALDCEMVGIGTNGKQSALARVSMVDWHFQTLLDTFVQVPSKVTDFRTFVSGVRAKDIQSKHAMNVVECRRKVAEILRNKILVGHALKNDLQALLLQHPKENIRDTAKYRPFQRASGPNGGKWRPRKLRDLVKQHLDKSIQVEGESHDSVEDAKATMELFQRVREAWEKELEAKQKKKHRKRK